MLQRVNDDLMAAMKNQDKFIVSVLRMLKSALKNEEINKKDSLTDAEVLTVIKKQVKTRKDSREEYITYGRTDLAESLEKEIEVLNQYLPEELSDEEVEKIIDNIILEIGADGMKSMGLVIKAVGAKCGAAVDMKKVSTIVKDKLNKA